MVEADHWSLVLCMSVKRGRLGGDGNSPGGPLFFEVVIASLQISSGDCQNPIHWLSLPSLLCAKFFHLTPELLHLGLSWALLELTFMSSVPPFTI